MYVVMENKQKVAAMEYLPFRFTFLHFGLKTITGESPEKKFHASSLSCLQVYNTGLYPF
jgi:hypothetical protein